MIDEIIPEPIGGAHRDRDKIILTTRKMLRKHLQDLQQLDRTEVINQRKSKFLAIGRQKGFVTSIDSQKIGLGTKEKIFNSSINFFFQNKKIIILTIAVLLIIIIFGLIIFS